MSKAAPGVRYAECERETKETRVSVVLDLDGGHRRDIQTGIPFFDHMLTQLAFHGRMNIGVTAEGDLSVEDHHTVEDVGIVLGTALAQALESEDSIERYASSHVVMDDAMVLAALDISGRPGLWYDVPLQRDRLGGLSTENVHEFWRAFALNAGISLHVRKEAGTNDHHIVEATFKAVGRALRDAIVPLERNLGGSSTKGPRTP
ncbi:MAG: imidazoleglycerol-phosphate dehydratase HisB [Armatimonadota bacterium]